MEHLGTIRDYLRTSFWFVPSLMSVGEAADARAALSTILSSMITMASLVFSITMVVLSLAARQFGPRLIRSFMTNLQTQIVLGTFVITIVYCCSSFRSTCGGDRESCLTSASASPRP
jgi:uncharacterized membrane protein